VVQAIVARKLIDRAGGPAGDIEEVSKTASESVCIPLGYELVSPISLLAQSQDPNKLYDPF
jgi:hypothetical protein